MSYCHDCSTNGAGNIDLVFHPHVKDIMHQLIDQQDTSCMREGRDPVYVDGANNTGVEDGTMFNPYNTVIEGTEAVLPHGTVLIAPGIYPQTDALRYPSTLKKNGVSGDVIINK